MERTSCNIMLGHPGDLAVPSGRVDLALFLNEFAKAIPLSPVAYSKSDLRNQLSANAQKREVIEYN